MNNVDVQTCANPARANNIAALPSDNDNKIAVVIELRPRFSHSVDMKPATIFSLAAFLALGLGNAANAACYADYKAKQPRPLRLHYGVIELPDTACDARAKARAEIERRIASDGWQLLNVMSVFGEDGLVERKDSAGAYFLRF